MSLATIGLTLGSFLSKCLASEPIRMTTLWRTASKEAESGASARNSSNTGRRMETWSYNTYNRCVVNSNKSVVNSNICVVNSNICV